MSKQAFELVIHARAGQGAKSAAQFLAEAAILKGLYIQSWPNYGAERSGAPMMAFTRISKNPIQTHEPIKEADVMLILDPTLYGIVDLSTLSKNGILIGNSCDLSFIKSKTNFKGKIKAINGTEISMKHLGRDFPNMPLLGALVGITKIVDINNLLHVVRKYFQNKLGEEMTKQNLKAVKEGYETAK
ncbi:MAG: 2-oxoacid:acceptor oxidoreductase family protein [Nanoarchaeota archaeon]|nr:2-oxoacid:acceptor oxidoreductase family protein [Nanoarchaeota archaeon]MBU4352714.1 2-oxoacid:acceptor oxidoreductase family protein [Nanoarchaeota archaeon]MBU4456760.1 2-oxoacid:acceptor oxidoreductase family protein [Nanoarchaeota archaeon]MCG2720343.1 2-oxoacid:acceptor oxidoreductase family protein [Nanoarchaeota archaeon]